MNRLSVEKQAQVLKALVDGCSIRATCRMTGVAKNTVLKLLVDIGAACSDYQDGRLRNLNCRRIQADEAWAFVYAKRDHLPEHLRGVDGVGDAWTWTALDADTKLMVSWFVGNRDADAAQCFMDDVASRLANRVQLTTDGHKVYLTAVEEAFGANVDYAMLVKLYGPEPEGEKRYSPSKCIGAEAHTVTGNPEAKHISTSYVERQNLTMRMGMRRFTRLTNAFSKKIENLAAAVSLHFMYYNYCRPHQTLTKANKGYPTTPAMAAGIEDHVWTLKEVADLLNFYGSK